MIKFLHNFTHWWDYEFNYVRICRVCKLRQNPDVTGYLLYVDEPYSKREIFELEIKDIVNDT